MVGTGGTGGDPGTGGTGGDPGTGGTGGEPLCGTKACAGGEECNRQPTPPRCECVSLPEDSCTAFDPGTVCGPGNACIPRPPAPPPVDFGDCDGVQDFGDDGKFACWPVTGGRKIWVRLCMESSDECVRPDTVCLRETEGVPICWWNLCDEFNTDTGAPDGNKRNGSAFGACDASTGAITPGRTPTGTCLPEEGPNGTVYLCNASGGAVAGDPCRFDAFRGDADLCAQGTQRLTFTPGQTPCNTDADCDPTQACDDGTCGVRECDSDDDCGSDGYCLRQRSEPRICIPKGECFETCNAGAAHITADFATCASTENGCFGLGETLGYCDGPRCDLFDGGCEDGEACRWKGRERSDFHAGACTEAVDATAAEGEPCGDGVSFLDGLFCAGVCRRFCACEGEGGWQPNGVCKTSSSQCAAGEVCAASEFGGDHLGLCLPESLIQP